MHPRPSAYQHARYKLQGDVREAELPALLRQPRRDERALEHRRLARFRRHVAARHERQNTKTRSDEFSHASPFADANVPALDVAAETIHRQLGSSRRFANRTVSRVIQRGSLRCAFVTSPRTHAASHRMLLGGGKGAR